MLKGIIIYSSQNGSTKKIAERIKERLQNEKTEVDLYNTHQGQTINLSKYDFIGIGCPVYNLRPSYEMLDFLDKLNGLRQKKIFTFVTYGTEIGDGANWLRKKLQQFGAIDIGHLSVSGKFMFPVYIKMGYLFSPNGPTDFELNKVDEFTEKLLIQICTNNTTEKDAYDGKVNFIGRFERLAVSKPTIKYLFSHFFKIDKNKCKACGACVKNCPQSNIQINGNNKPEWGRNCIMCTKCEVVCNQKAIKSPMHWLIFAPFFSYNIRRALKKQIPVIKTNRSYRKKIGL